MKAKSILIILAVLICCSPGFADQASHRSAAEQLIRMTNPDQVMEQMWEQVQAMSARQFQEMGASEEYKPVFEKYTQMMFGVLKDNLSFDKMKEDLIAIYVKTYTESEIQGIIDFYKTPAGKAMLEKMPRLMQETMIMTQRKMPVIMREIQGISAEMNAEIRKLEAN